MMAGGLRGRREMNLSEKGRSMMRRMWLRLVLISALALAAPVAMHAQSFVDASSANDAGDARECFAPPASQAAQSGDAHGFNLDNLDRSAKPCDNFFEFADGGWVKAHPIPAAYPRWGSFDELRANNEAVLHKILEDAAASKSAKPGSNLQKLSDFYSSCVNEPAIEAAGAKPLDATLAKIAAIHDGAGLGEYIAYAHRNGFSVVFSFSSEQDKNDSTQMIAGAGQGGLSLPDRDYYTKDDEKSVKLREAYVHHVANMFKLVGDDDAKADAEAKSVIDIETALAKASMTRVERRNPDATYHKMTVAEFDAETPNFTWPRFIEGVGSPSVASLNVRQPDFFKALNGLLTSESLDAWKSYLRWHEIHSMAPALSSAFVDENFAFFGKTLNGTEENLPRWRRCVQSTDRNLGEVLGQEYVRVAFPPAAKAKATEMVNNLIAALRDDIGQLDWMSPETKKQALEKLNAIDIKIGYPNKWRDYSGYTVVRGSYPENLVRGGAFETAFDLQQIGKPIDRTLWGMTPPTVNAYYSSSMNEIVFPAGILQPPFYDANRDDAMNYGGMGAVIGHEITHGFDDQGSKFDAKGNRRDWWTPEDLKNFTARADCVKAQFDGFEVEPGLHENGGLVEGESIADLGGLTIAYAALQKALAGKPAVGPIDGFTPDQRFFLGWAAIWAGTARPEYARVLVATDPHPLGQFRTNAPMSNMPAFAKAWGCAPDSPMVRQETARCRIW
jgi:putative endopeptidase